jgi:hypothetical protein
LPRSSAVAWRRGLHWLSLGLCERKSLSLSLSLGLGLGKGQSLLLCLGLGLL